MVTVIVQQSGERVQWAQKNAAGHAALKQSEAGVSPREKWLTFRTQGLISVRAAGCFAP